MDSLIVSLVYFSIAVRSGSKASIPYATLTHMSHTPARVKEYLKAVIDPELGVTIVDLGLIYGVEFPTEDTVKIIMTLTSMGCPLFGTIHDEIVSALKPLGYPADRIEVDLVWDPAWNQSMMSEEAKVEVGVE